MPLDPSTVVRLQHELDKLRQEHRQLDEKIAELIIKVSADDLRVHRLKKQKLDIKDKINKVEALFLPNIIA